MSGVPLSAQAGQLWTSASYSNPSGLYDDPGCCQLPGPPVCLLPLAL